MDARLKEQVLDSIAAFCNTSRDQVGTLSIEKKYDADRRIYRLVPQLKDAAFALKLRGTAAVKQSDLHHDAALDEFNRIKKAWAAVREVREDLGMPAPVDHYPEYQAILTTWCKGEELRQLYYRGAWRRGFPGKELQEYFRRSGEWLGRFHNASRHRASAGEAMRKRLDHVDRMLAFISDSPRNLLAAFDLSRLRELFANNFTEAPEASFGLLHGNFTLRNILASEAGVNPVDFEDSGEGIIEMDTGQFVADIILSAYRPNLPAAARRQLSRDFVSAYALHAPVDLGRLRTFTMYHILAAYYEVLGRRGALSASSLMAAHQARVFARMLAHPLETTEGFLQIPGK